MSVKIHLHQSHCQYTNGLGIIEANGSTVGECLDDLVQHYPLMEKVLFHSEGELHNQLEVYVNMKSAYPDELAKAVEDGDQIHLTLMFSGG
jgi:molybdopterin converting factor small subunit